MRDEIEGQAPAAPQRKLTPANENPWYVLMTLYGEQEGEEIDWELHERNREAWNAWAGQGLSEEARTDAAKSSGIDRAELEAWPQMAEEITARFQGEFRKRNPDIAEIPEIPGSVEPIRLSNTACTKTVVFVQAVFASDADFHSATFTQEAYFQSATFTQYAYFHSASFTQGAHFRSATFTQVADFPSATFTQGAHFHSATFTQRANFHSATFTRHAYFHSATFTQEAYFQSATFTQAAYFQSAIFTQGAYFHSANCTSGAYFHSATFGGFVHFGLTNFGGGRGQFGIAYFQDCQFEKPVSFRQALFRNGYPDFAGAVLHDKTSFTARRRPTADEIRENEKLAGEVYWPDKAA